MDETRISAAPAAQEPYTPEAVPEPDQVPACRPETEQTDSAEQTELSVTSPQTEPAESEPAEKAEIPDAQPSGLQEKETGPAPALSSASRSLPGKNRIPAEAEKPDTVTVIDVRFQTGSKVYYFDPGHHVIPAGAHVIVETSRGVEYATCAAGNHAVPEEEVVQPLRPVIRVATLQDERIVTENRKKETEAFDICRQKIQAHGLEMKLVSVEYAFDNSKILFYFTADGRVDFRELVKDLAAAFRTRIELRQIGVRDEAKMLGGLGICGRPFCCAQFLDDFQPVSIKMAKTQNLSLNPTKISGACGRLMCCLKYEQDAYEDLLKTSPKAESFVDTPDGRGTVTDVNLLRQQVTVRMETDPGTVKCYKNCDICILRSGKAKKNDPPIPDDLAPISSRLTRMEQTPEEENFSLPEPMLIGENGEPQSAAAPAGEKSSRAEPAAEQSRSPRRRGGGGQSASRQRNPNGSEQGSRRRQEKNRTEQNSRNGRDRNQPESRNGQADGGRQENRQRHRKAGRSGRAPRSEENRAEKNPDTDS